MTRVADGFKKEGDSGNAKMYYYAALKIRPSDMFALMGLGQLAVIENDPSLSEKPYTR
jgi:hypothetical protein